MQHGLKMKNILIKTIPVLLLLAATQAHAELVSISYTNTQNEVIKTSPEKQYINPVGDISFSLSAGIERKVRISIINEEGITLSTKTSELLGANSRITINGNEYYGDILTLPFPGEGKYTFKAEIISGQDNSIQSDNYPITIDITPPVFNNEIKKIGYGSHSINVITNNAYGENTIGTLVVENVKDDQSPISNAVFFSIDKNNVRKEIPAINDTEQNKISILINKIVNDTLTPYDNSTYTMGFGAYDSSGNYSEISRSINVEKKGDYLLKTEIYNPNEEKWIPYTPNMTIYENPVRARDIRNKNDHVFFNGTDYGWSDKSYQKVDEDYTYREFSFLYPGNSNYITYVTKAGNYKYTRFNSFKFTLSDNVYIPSKPLKIIYKLKDGDWSANGTPQLKKPSTIEKVRIFAEKRNHNQRANIALNSKFCIIPSNEDYCDIDFDHNVSTGSGYRAFSYSVGDENGKNMLFGGYLYTYWDFDAPEVNKITYDESEQVIVANIYDKNRRLINSPGMFQTRIFDLFVESNDVVVYKPISIEELDIHNYKVKFDASKITDGQYKIGVRATDTYDNVSEIKYIENNIIIDRTAPKLEILANNKINKLDDVKIRMSDNHPEGAKFTMVQLTGGATNENINLPVRSVGNDEYQLEYPVLFPTLEENQEYVLNITAEDPQGNKTSITKKFQYEPPRINLVNGNEKILIPAVPNKFYTKEGLNALELEALTLGDGSFVSGQYDVIATLRADSEIPLSFNGVVVNPGETKEIINSYDFGKTQGKLSIPIQAVETNKKGKSTIMVTTTAPNSAMLVIDVETWSASAKLQSSKPSYVQLLDPIKVRAVEGPGSGCVITSDKNKAINADNINEPFCLFEWDSKPEEVLEISNDSKNSYPELAGVISNPGQYPLQYSLYLYDYSGERFKLDEGQANLNIVGFQDNLSYGFDNIDQSFIRSLESIQLNLKQKMGYDCEPTTNEFTAKESAMALNSTSKQVYCLVEWKDLAGLTSINEFSPVLSGYIDQAGTHNLSWTISSFDSKGTKYELLNESETISVIDPVAPQISLNSPYFVNDNTLVFPVSTRSFGDVEIVSSNGNLLTQIKLNNELVEDLATSPFSNGNEYLSRIRIKPFSGKILEKNTFSVESKYELLPAIKGERVYSSYTVPHIGIKPAITMAKQAVSTDPFTVEVNIVNTSNLKQEYSKESMGTWSVRLMKQATSKQEAEPLTDFMEMNNGYVSHTFEDLSIFSNDKSLKLYAEAKLHVPEELSKAGYERLEISNGTAFVQILLGNEIDGEISTRKLSGEAPFSTTFNLKLDNRELAASLGTVQWQIRKKGDTAWIDADINEVSKLQFRHTFDTGAYEVRALVTNRHSGISALTELIEVVAYDKVGIEIQGVGSAFIGSTQTYTANLFSKKRPTLAEQEQINAGELKRSDIISGTPIAINDHIIEWSMDGGKTFTQQGPSIELSSEEPIRYSLAARVKPIDSPEDDKSAYEIERMLVSFQKVKAPGVRIRGDSVAEVDKPLVLRAETSLPYRNMNVEVKGFFTLPSGETIEQSEITYTPTEADIEKGALTFTYTAWIEGYREKGAENTTQFRTKAWKYIWPTFVMNSRLDVRVAPATSILTVRSIGFKGELDNVKYEWRLPANADLVSDSPTTKHLFIKEPGTYEAMVKVSDNRGNATDLTTSFTVTEAEAFSLIAKPSYGNANMREPLNLRFGSQIRGGHPQDRIVKLDYKLNGIPMEISGSTASVTGLMAGSYTGTVEIESKMGQKLQETINFEVAKNKRPVCNNITYRQTVASLILTADCADEDGRIQGYEWSINGEIKQTNSNRLTINLKSGQTVPTVTVLAIDDVGARSLLQTMNP